MAITLRNKKVEEDIREIGRHTGEGPSAVIARGRSGARAHRVAQIRAFTSTLPVFTDEERAAMLREQDSPYDDEAAGERSDGEDEPGA